MRQVERVNLCILSLGNVSECLCSRVNNVQQLDDGGSIVRDCDFLAVVDQFVHTTGAECGANLREGDLIRGYINKTCACVEGLRNVPHRPQSYRR